LNKSIPNKSGYIPSLDNPEFFCKLIDFGLGHTYLMNHGEVKNTINHSKNDNLPEFLTRKEPKHILNNVGDPFQCFKGNLLFASKNSFLGHTLSRRDDIISALYILIFLISGKIPLSTEEESIRK
jgi:hypothetical protein